MGEVPYSDRDIGPGFLWGRSATGAPSGTCHQMNRQREKAMAKGQQKGNREPKKPKGEKPKGSVSAYKQLLSKSGQSIVPPKK